MKGKQKMRRATALLLALILAFGVSFVSTAPVQEVQAAETEKGIFNRDNEDLVLYGNELMEADPVALQIYQALRTITTETKTLEVEFDPPVAVSYEEASPRIRKAMQMAFDAFRMDYPEIFWSNYITPIKDPSTGPITYSFTIVNGVMSGAVTKLTLEVDAPESYGNLSEAYDAVYQKLMACVDNAKDLSVADQLKLYHDFLCEQLSYDKKAPNAHDMYGALIGGKCVCEGYAKSFKALCDLSGIPCQLVVGKGVTEEEGKRKEEEHMWNYCLVDDKWYAVDATWDDQEAKIYYEYFLAGSETPTPNFPMDTFSESHVPDGDFAHTGYHTFEFKELSSTAYPRGEEPTPPGPTPPEPAIQYGDVDGDGDIISKDALCILRAAAQIEPLDDAQKERADVKKDGNITSADALLILQYAAKIINHFEAA